MVITYGGENYFKIQAGNLTVLIDPTNQRSFRGADLILKTDLEEKPSTIEEEGLVVNFPGEYEAKEIRVYGSQISEEKKKIIYRLEIDEMRIGVLGNLKNELTSKTLEGFFDIDVLIAPLIPKTIKQIKPSLLVVAPEKNLKSFLKDLGKDKCETEEKIVVKKKDLKPKGLAIVCLKE